MKFEPMDPEEALQAIEGHVDLLTPEVVAQHAFHRQFRCPRCKADSLQRRIDPRHCFAGDQLTPRALLRCQFCELVLEPDTGLIVMAGNPAKQAPAHQLHDIGPGPAQQALAQMVGDQTGQDLELVRQLLRSSVGSG